MADLRVRSNKRLHCATQELIVDERKVTRLRPLLGRGGVTAASDVAHAQDATVGFVRVTAEISQERNERASLVARHLNMISSLVALPKPQMSKPDASGSSVPA